MYILQRYKNTDKNAITQKERVDHELKDQGR